MSQRFRIDNVICVLIFIPLLSFIDTSASSADVVNNFQLNFDTIKNKVSAETQEKAAYDVIQRLLPDPELHNSFRVNISSELTGNSFKVIGYFNFG